MPTSQLLDLAKLSAPNVLEQLDAEQLLTSLKTSLLNSNPELANALALESEPLTQLLNAYAYQSTLLRARVNDAAKSTLLASATGSDLDHIAARYSVTRLINEDDERLRHRTQKAFHSLNTAGSQESYEYHTLSADPRVKDVFVTSPSPSHIVITILSNENPQGQPSVSLMHKLETTFGLKAGDQNSVSDVLAAQKIRPIGDRVQLVGATTQPFSLQANIKLELGPGHAQVEQQVRQKVAGYLQARSGLGQHIKRSALFAVLHQPGVEEVELLSPSHNVVGGNNEVALCDNALDGLQFEVLL